MLIHDVPFECVNQAAIEYNIPASIIVSVLDTEGGRVGSKNINSNGSYDLGPMQINSVWLSVFSKYGITENEIRNDPCINIKVGSWILANKIAANNNLWNGIGDYHSKATSLNYSYQKKVEYKYKKIVFLLNTN